MEINKILKDTDGKIAYYESVDFFRMMSEISDVNVFGQMMDEKIDFKSSIEEGLIYLLVSKKELKDFEISFLDKYHKYLNLILDKDVREYYNNKYCFYLYSNSWNSLSSTDNIDEAMFINGQSLSQIDNLLINKHNQLMDKIRNGEGLDGRDRKFLEESFLSVAFNDIIYKEFEGENDLMYDIVDYFTKYSIRDISNSRNKQLYILFSLSNKIIQIPSNCAIQFTSDVIVDEYGFKTLGSFGKIKENNVPCIKINGLDIYELKTESEFLKKMFTLFHELGHFKQHAFFDEFNDETKKVILMEKDLINDNTSFYKKYHDSFLIERDADNYAVVEFIKEYGEQYPFIVHNIVSKNQKRKRINLSDFYFMEIEEYSKTISKGQNKKNNFN